MSAAESRHLVQVRRARRGEPVEVLNGCGGLGHGTLADPNPRAAVVDLAGLRQTPPAAIPLRLLLAMPKPKTWDDILPCVVELGVTELVPLLSAHVEGSAERHAGKAARQRQILLEALKQSGQPWLPRLAEPVPFAALPRVFADGALRACAALQSDAVGWSDLVARQAREPAAIELLVGPEGDFSGAEYAALRAWGVRFFTLGPTVLRVATAVVSVLALANEVRRIALKDCAGAQSLGAPHARGAG